MLTECRRVLRPGGVIRVVVPDLEGIARHYLKSLDAIDLEAGELAFANHRWMTLELVDQMTRQSGGGKMGPMMRRTDQINRDFIQSRLGHETRGNSKSKLRKTIGMRAKRIFSDLRKHFALAAVAMIEGRDGAAAYREGRFRNSGEIHRWMYDRVSLSQLMRDVGFEAAQVCTAGESRIGGFDGFQLDRDGESARKPDSLYMEAIKPNQAALARVAESVSDRAA